MGIELAPSKEVVAAFSKERPECGRFFEGRELFGFTFGVGPDYSASTAGTPIDLVMARDHFEEPYPSAIVHGLAAGQFPFTGTIPGSEAPVVRSEEGHFLISHTYRGLASGPTDSPNRQLSMVWGRGLTDPIETISEDDPRLHLDPATGYFHANRDEPYLGKDVFVSIQEGQVDVFMYCTIETLGIPLCSMWVQVPPSLMSAKVTFHRAMFDMTPEIVANVRRLFNCSVDLAAYSGRNGLADLSRD